MAESAASRLAERGEKRYGGKRSRANGKALAYGRRRVPEGIEGIGNLSYVFSQAAHLGDASCVVGNGAVSVHAHYYAGRREHPDRGQPYAVDACRVIRYENCHRYGGDRQGAALKPHRYAGYYIGACAGCRRVGYPSHRLAAWVIIAPPPHDAPAQGARRDGQ